MDSFIHVSPARQAAGLIAAAAVVALVATWPALGGAVFPDIEECGERVKAVPFRLDEVRLLPGPFRDAMLRDQAYLLSLDPERLLHTFRRNVGLPSDARPYGGWEGPECEVRGHSVGHYLSACSEMYASTGEETFKERADRIVAGFAQCQAEAVAAGFHAGYLSAYPESFIDRVETGKGVWAPWYTLHKIYAGLLDSYELTGNRQALEVLLRAVDWIDSRVSRLSHDQMQRSLMTEFGGMNEVLANVYAITKNPRDLRLAQAFDHQFVFGPLAAGEDRLDGLHANTQIPKVIGAAREYELTGDQSYRRIAQFFWERVALNRSYVIGGHSDREHFFPTNDFARHLSAETAETCNTHNMLKLTRHLFAWQPSASTMDFYERALYNHILASQDPAKGMFVYLMSLKPGHFKTYSTPEDSFWCCVGTGMENHARYGESIYFHSADTLYVNMFIASELEWKERGVTLRQETAFPESDASSLVIHSRKPQTFALAIRCPSWAQPGFRVQVNGKAATVKTGPGTYAVIQRKWRDGDRVDLKLPMRLHFEPLPGSQRWTALLYGPLVLAGELGRQGLTNDYARGQTDQVRLPAPRPPVFLCNRSQLLDAIEKVSDRPLRFRTVGIGRPADVTLAPFYQVHHQRYSVYWELMSAGEYEAAQAESAAAERRLRERAAVTIDSVAPGDAQSEAAHDFHGEQTQAGEFDGRGWRHAVNGGWFRYRMTVSPDLPASLVCTFWGDDTGGREFDILVEGRRLGTQKLDRNRPGEFFEVEYPVPAELTRGKTNAIIQFQALPGRMAGGVFGCDILKRR